MNHHAVTVDIGDFEMEPFLKPEAAGINRSQESMVLGSLHASQQASHLFDAEHCGQSPLILGSQDAEDVPVTLEDVLKEEADAAIAVPHDIG